MEDHLPAECPNPCPNPAHFVQHLIEVIDWATTRTVSPRAQVTISPALRDQIADVDTARERALDEAGPIERATRSIADIAAQHGLPAQIAGLPVRVDPSMPPGVVALVPLRASEDAAPA